MKHIERPWYMEDINFMEALTPEEKDLLIHISTLKHFKKGQYVFIAEEPDDSVYVIKKGRLKSFLLTKDGKDIILYIRYPGDLTGITSLCGIQRRTTYLSALEDSLVWASSTQVFYEFVSKRPHIMFLIMKILLARHYQSKILIQDIIANCAQKRLANFLLRLAQERGQLIHDGNAQLPMELTHEQISQMIGTCRQTTTRLLNAFKDRKYIEKDGRILQLNTKMLRLLVEN
jgi:CRP-like cAMP-binding protein